MRLPHRLLITILGAVAISACGTDTASLPPSATAAGTGSSASAAVPTTPAAAPCFTPQAGADSFKGSVTLQPAAADGLQYGDFHSGCGAAAKTGDQVTVQYTGWLSDGTQFDSSRQAGRAAFQFTVGQGVIQGWSEGVVGMKVGGKRRLVIPASLGYGAAGQPPTIPANATLTFDIELLSIP